METNKIECLKMKMALIISFLCLIGYTCYAQENAVFSLPVLNIVPDSLSNADYQYFHDKSLELQKEIGEFTEKSRMFNQKCAGVEEGSEQDKQCQTEFNVLNSWAKSLIAKINVFNSEIEKAVFEDPSMQKALIVSYYSLKTEPAKWDKFEVNVTKSTFTLKDNYQKMQLELHSSNIKKQANKTLCHEGIILGMLTDWRTADSLEKNGTSPFTGRRYQDMNKKMSAGKTIGSGVVVVSFGTQELNHHFIQEILRGVGDHAYSGTISLTTSQAIVALNKLNGKKFNRLIAHSNGASVAECLLRERYIETEELDIIGGDKSLLDGHILQQLLDDGIVKRIVVWINWYDPVIWLTAVDQVRMEERETNYMLHWKKYGLGETKGGDSEVKYRYFASQGSSTTSGFFNPHYLETYFQEIQKTFGVK
jgi:hypothetical protein